MKRLLGRPVAPSRVLALGLAAAIAIALAMSVAVALVDRFPGDLAASQRVQAMATPWLDSAMLAVRYLGDDAVAVGSVLLLAGVLAGRRRWPEAVAFLSVLPLEVLLRLPKALVDRPRPVEELVRVLDSGSSGSFPSGHVFHAVAMLGLALVILVFPIRSAWPRRVASVVLVAMIFLSGLSSVYLGAHWPSDVIGSLAYGVPSVVLLYYLCVRLKRRWAQG